MCTLKKKVSDEQRKKEECSQSKRSTCKNRACKIFAPKRQQKIVCSVIALLAMIYACITSTAFSLSHLLLLSTTANQPSLHFPFLFVLSSSHSHTTTHFLHWLLLVLFFLGFAFSSFDVHCRNKITGHRGAWHLRLEKAQKLSSHACPISIRKELS